jgi:hypothetical protein
MSVGIDKRINIFIIYCNPIYKDVSLPREKEDEGEIEVLRLQAELCKSLSDPKRLRIIRELRGGGKKR